MESPRRRERREVMDSQLTRREELRQRGEEMLEERRDQVVADSAAIREAIPRQGMATVRVGLGTVTLYGE